MASLESYGTKNLQILIPANEVTGDGGNAINTNFQIISDALDAAVHQDTRDPTANDNAAAGYLPGSMWLNTTTNKAFICLSSSPSTAAWTAVNAPPLATTSTPGIVEPDGTTILSMATARSVPRAAAWPTRSPRTSIWVDIELSTVREVSTSDRLPSRPTPTSWPIAAGISPPPAMPQRSVVVLSLVSTDNSTQSQSIGVVASSGFAFRGIVLARENQRKRRRLMGAAGHGFPTVPHRRCRHGYHGQPGGGNHRCGRVDFFRGDQREPARAELQRRRRPHDPLADESGTRANRQFSRRLPL